MLQSSSSASSSTHWGQCRAQQVKMSVCSRQTVCEHVWRDTTFRYCPMYERFCKSCEWEHMIANIDDMSFRYQSVDSTELFIMNTVFILLFFFSHIAKYVICRMLLQKSIFFSWQINEIIDRLQYPSWPIQDSSKLWNAIQHPMEIQLFVRQTKSLPQDNRYYVLSIHHPSNHTITILNNRTANPHNPATARRTCSIERIHQIKYLHWQTTSARIHLPETYPLKDIRPSQSAFTIQLLPEDIDQKPSGPSNRHRIFRLWQSATTRRYQPDAIRPETIYVSQSPQFISKSLRRKAKQ